MPAHLPAAGLELGPSRPILRRDISLPEPSPEIRNQLASLQRGELIGDTNQLLFHLNQSLSTLVERGITSGMTAFPARENLEAEAKILVPTETPVRNRLHRIPGSGTASAWKQNTSLGGGWAAGDQPGEGPGAVRAFFSESGAPAEHTSVYANKSSAYKLLGTLGSVTGFAAAAGASFDNAIAREKSNAILNLMLNEENALINGDATSIVAPWGDGATALAFNGLINLITVANGTPATQVQAAVGALTTAHIDAQLKRIWAQGAQRPWIVCNGTEVLSLVHLAEASGTVIRVQATSDGKTVLGVQVTGYVNPITGEIVDVVASRFCPAGTMLFLSDAIPDGTPTLDVDVLPQVQLPQLAPNDSVQGYTAQELAPTTAAPQVYPFIVTVFEVLRLKSALHVAKSSGITAV